MLYKQTSLVIKKQKGQYFTHPAIAKKIVEEICNKIILDYFWNPLITKSNSYSLNSIELLLDRILDLRFLDPAMGEGVFLIEVMTYFENFPQELSSKLQSSPLRKKVNNYFQKKFSLDFECLIEGDKLALDIWKLHILRSMIYGVDLDKDIVKFTREKIIDTFKTSQISKIARIASKVNIRKGNSLVSPVPIGCDFNHNLLNKFPFLINKLLSLKMVLQRKQWTELNLHDLEVILTKEKKIRKELLTQIINQSSTRLFSYHKLSETSFIWEIEFPEVFLSDYYGFNVVLGNPPWDKWKMYNREWLGSTSLSKSDNVEKINGIRLIDDKANKNYLSLKQFYRITSKYFDTYYKWQPGEKNLYKLFLERSYHLCCNTGFLGIIIPGGLLGEYYCKPLRLMLLTKMNLLAIVEIISNSEIFPDAEPGLSILIVIAQKDKPDDNFKFIKGIKVLDDLVNLNINLKNRNFGDIVTFKNKNILETSPRFIIPAIKNNLELVITNKITKHPSLSSSAWGCKTSRGLDMTNDKALLHKTSNFYPLIEGRHLVRLGFDNTTPRYFIHSIERYKKKIPFWDQTIIAWKNFSGNHRRRRMRIAVLPPGAAISNSVICLYHLPAIPDVEYYLAGIMCSIPFEFRIRQLCYGLNINQFVIDGMTVPKFNPINAKHQMMVILTKDFIPRGNKWAQRKMKAKSTLLKAKLEDDYKEDITKIDAAAAIIYDFSRSEFEATLKAHPLLEEEYRKMALSHFDQFLVIR